MCAIVNRSALDRWDKVFPRNDRKSIFVSATQEVRCSQEQAKSMAGPRNPGSIDILIVSNNSGIYTQTALWLNTSNCSVTGTQSPEEYAEHIHRGAIPHLVFLDMDIPNSDGLGTIESWKKLRPGQKIVAFSAAEDARSVVQTIRAGALDYVTMPWDEARLRFVLQQYFPGKLAHGNIRNTLNAQTSRGNVHFEDLGNGSFFMAASPSMKQIRSQAALIAKVDVPVLVLGESGVGKEIVVRLIHKLSGRVGAPLLKVNCAALPADLLESELFGYEAGAFTGAVRSKPGKFELCHKGAILLDEIGEMSPAMQAKLLHVLQDGQYSRLGGCINMRPDVRIFAATNIDMEQAIANKSFREDLYYRLSAFTVNVPPLRERQAEIAVLFDEFMNQYSSKYDRPPLEYSETLAAACLRHHWPGNLREFENFVKRYIILQDEAAAISELAARTGDRGEPNSSYRRASDAHSRALKPLVRSVTAKAEAEAISQALDATQWNAKAAAARLRISYKALLYKMKQFQLGAAMSHVAAKRNSPDQYS